MAVVPYSPVATTLPQTNAGNDYINVQANPSAFGGIAAQANEKIGSGLSSVAQSADKWQDFTNRVAGDKAYYDFQSQGRTLLNGDPNNPNDHGYFGKMGDEAWQSRPQAINDLEALRQKIKAGMPSPAAQLQFDEDSRRLSSMLISTVDSHAQQQFMQSAAANKSALIGEAAQHAGDFWNNPDAVNSALSDADKSARDYQAILGHHDDASMSQAAFAARQNVHQSVVRNMGAADPQKAFDYVSAHQADFDAQTYNSLLNAYRGKADQAAASSLVSQATGGAANLSVHDAIGQIAGVPGPQPGVAPSLIQNAFGQVEAGGRTSGVPTSDRGAVGPGQIIPATFERFAKPGEDINNPSDNIAVRNRMLDTYNKQYNGDTARVAVAYFSGEGNVAPIGSPTPWKQNTSDGHSTVSQYVSKIQALTGQGGGFDLDAAQRYIEQNATSPQVAADAVAKLQRQAALQQKAFKDTEDGAANEYVSQMLKDPGKINPDDIANDNRLSWQVKAHISNMLSSAVDGVAGKDITKTMGPGFWDAWKRVHADDGEPGKITNPNDIYGMAGPGGSLTLEGVDRLVKDIKGRGTIDGEADSAMMKQFFTNARAQITGSNEGLHIRDPEGDDKFLRFQAAAYKALGDGQKQNLSIPQMTSPDSPDYIGKSLIPQFVRPPDQWFTSTNGEAPSKLDLSTKENVIKALNDKKIPYDVAASALRAMGLRSRHDQPAGPRVPTDE